MTTAALETNSDAMLSQYASPSAIAGTGRSHSTRSSRPSPDNTDYSTASQSIAASVPRAHRQSHSYSSSPSAAARAQQYQKHQRHSSTAPSTTRAIPSPSSAEPASIATYSHHLNQYHSQQRQTHVSTIASTTLRGHHRRTSSSIRTPQSAPPKNDYENSNVATFPKRSHDRSRDPPTQPPSGRSSARPGAAADPSRLPHRTQSAHVSSHSKHHRRSSADSHTSSSPRKTNGMAPSASNGTPSAQPAVAPDTTHSSSTKPGRSRTTIPTQSGKWILGKTIGAGSMGKVKLARKEDGSEQVACKIIPRGSTDDGHQSRADKERADQSKEIRTAREAAIVTLLNHPHICGLRDVVRTNYHWYMLFEYVNGGQMLDYIISHGKLKEKQARKFCRQIASALDYCHRNSIVHRDLKIENILISKTGDIKIIDFGLSNLFAPKGHLKTFCGSLYFAAPELLQARAYTGPEVDVWSFGIVLYVLVCGKVPFDDQSMPALHAKIKKGVVDYPSWISSECKHLLSRMLVTDPKLRASMSEVMSHPWMAKGFSGPPDNYLPPREPLSTPLEPEVIHAMQGFNFGPPESIRAQLTKIIESEEYQRAIRLHLREREQPTPSKDGEKKRGFGFDFYKRRNSGTSRDTLTNPSSEALQLGTDPLNAFSPLLSIYYLVKEKQDRDRVERAQIMRSGSPGWVKAEERRLEYERTQRELWEQRQQERDKDREREQGHREHRDYRESERDRETEHARRPEVLPDLTPPQAAHTNSATYEMPGEKPTGGRTRPRARTHGEDDVPDSAKPLSPSQPEYKQEQQHHHHQKKESTATGLLRRFSTRKRREPERLDKDRSHPPVVHVQAPANEPAPITPRKSFSIRRGRRDRDEIPVTRQRSGSTQPQRSELLSPPATAGGSRDSRRGVLGRSTSVNSAEMRRRKSTRTPKEPLPATSGSEQSMGDEPPSSSAQGLGHSKSVAMRAKSLGHARRESIQQRRMRREAAQEANVPEETDMEQEASGVSTERLDKEDLAKPVFLKGLFSVSTTSGKSVPAIRADIRRVLKQLNVDYIEIKGGFTCKHMPSIDLNKVQDPPTSPGPPSAGGGHRRRFSFGGLMRGDDRGEEVRDPSDRQPTTPRTPGRDRDRDRSYSNSETSVDSIPRRTNGGASRRAPGETSTQVQSDLGGSMVLEFEIFIVKVPLLSMHGIQFKRLDGNTWQYKNMADQILRELRL